MRSQQERNQLQQLVGSPQWRTLELVAQELCARLESEPKVKDSEWETLTTTLVNEGKVRGIETLLQEVIKEAHGNESS